MLPLHPSNRLCAWLSLCLLFGRPAAAELLLPPIRPVSSVADLQLAADTAWTNRITSALYPPGLSFTNALPVLAVSPGFEPAFLASLSTLSTPGGITLRKGIVREDLSGRRWFGAAATPVASTSFPIGYDPAQWVLDTFPPPAGITGQALDDYIADRRLTRQALAFTLIDAVDVPAYLDEIATRLAAAPPRLAQEDIGVVQVDHVPALGTLEFLVHAPPEVDYLGVYETLNLMNPFPWIPLGTVPHTVDPMAWSYPPPGNLGCVILANHVLDSDLDGIVDAMEKLVLGSRTDQWDSDGDGVGDHDEVYLHRSNPLDGGGAVGGRPDQVSYGLGLPDQDMDRVISGSAGLRFNMRRAARDKQGFTGFVDAATRFLGYQSDFNFGQCGVHPYAQHVHYDGAFDLDHAQPMRHYEVTCPMTREGAGWNVPLFEVGIPNAAPMYMPAPDDPLAGGETRGNTSGTAGSGGMTSSGSLSRPYSDDQLLARTSADYAGLRTGPVAWDHWLLLTRPLGGAPGDATAENVGPSEQAFDSRSGYPPRAARKYVRFQGEGAVMRAELQGMGVQATAAPESIPPGYLLRTIHLEVARKPPTEACPEGEIIRVTPR